MEKIMSFKLVTLLLSICFCQASFAVKTSDMRNALKNSSWGKKTNNNSRKRRGQRNTSTDDAAVSSSQVSTAIQACEKKDQTFVPYEEFLYLVQGHEVKVSHSPTSGELKINGDKMIGNCNSMLDPDYTEAKNGRPHLFHVAIAKPSSCAGKDKCSYKVSFANDEDLPGIKSEEKTMEFEPTFFGFQECLKASGVYKDGVIQEDKITPVPFELKKNGVYDDGELAFYSKGPYSQQLGAVYGEVEASGGSCDFFEKVSESGFRVLSQETVKANDQKALFDKICGQGDYKLIEEYLPDFAEAEQMYFLLKEVRNIYLMEEMAELHSLLANNPKDFSNLDAGKYKGVIEDYYNKIVQPLKGKIARLRSDLNGASKKKRKSIQADIDFYVDKLISYTQKPYLTKDDFKSMKLFVKKAQLDNDDWVDAAGALYSANNSIYHYSRFKSDSKLDDISLSSTNKLVKDDISRQKELLGKLSDIAKDPNKSYAREYDSAAQNIIRSQQANIQDFYAFEQEEKQYIQSYCMDPRKYWLNRQRCVQNVQVGIEDSRYATQQFNNGLNHEVARYQQLSSEWGQVEKLRNGGTGNQPNPGFSALNYNPNQGQQFQIPGQQNNRNGNQNGQDFWSRVGQPNRSQQPNQQWNLNQNQQANNQQWNPNQQQNPNQRWNPNQQNPNQRWNPNQQNQNQQWNQNQNNGNDFWSRVGQSNNNWNNNNSQNFRNQWSQNQPWSNPNQNQNQNWNTQQSWNRNPAQQWNNNGNNWNTNSGANASWNFNWGAGNNNTSYVNQNPNYNYYQNNQYGNRNFQSNMPNNYYN
jgi:hypothetical protein